MTLKQINWSRISVATINFLSFINFSLILLTGLGANLWIGEILVSFLPQHIILAFVVITINLVYFKADSNYRWLVIERNIIIVLALILGIYGSYQVYNFAFANELKMEAKTIPSLENTIKVVSYNKLYFNTDYSQAATGILETNADIVGILEIDPDSELTKTLEKEYPFYYASKYKSKKVELNSLNIMLFSKTKLENTEYFSINGAPGLFAETQINNKKYSIMLAHPSSPLFPTSLKERNEQLNIIVDKVQNYSKDQSNFVLMGDFNISPWSPDYNNFSSKLEGFYNTSAGRGLFFSWDAGKFFTPFNNLNSVLFQTHIDHIFVSDSLYTFNFGMEGNYGSDHSLVWAKIGPK